MVGGYSRRCLPPTSPVFLSCLRASSRLLPPPLSPWCGSLSSVLRTRCDACAAQDKTPTSSLSFSVAVVCFLRLHQLPSLQRHAREGGDDGACVCVWRGASGRNRRERKEEPPRRKLHPVMLLYQRDEGGADQEKSTILKYERRRNEAHKEKGRCSCRDAFRTCPNTSAVLCF